jgi:spore coat polysaccharide biosynthesis protein SpsF
VVQKVLAIVQARMGSSRLPGKSLLHVGGKPLIEHVTERVHATSTIDKVVFAIPNSEDNRLLHHFLSRSLGEVVYIGSETDVLERFAQVVQVEQPTHVVRITADDPLKDPAVIDLAVKHLLDDSHLRYVTNSIDATYPEGIDVEAFTAEALLDANRNATEDFEREHVTPFIWNRPNQFPSLHFRAQIDLSAWRWTLDNYDDWLFLDSILKRLQDGNEKSDFQKFDYQNVVRMLENDDVLRALMPNQKRSVSKIVDDRIGNA